METTNVNCLFLLLGFATLVTACVMSAFCWQNWEELKKEENPIDWTGGPGNKAWFMWYIVTLSVSALILLGKPLVYLFQALGMAGGIQYVMGLVVGLLIYAWARVVDRWETIRKTKKFVQSWELAWAGCVGPAVLAAIIVALTISSRGKICM